MADSEPKTEGIDLERVERHLRSVRLKLVAARRELQTLLRQSGMARGKHGMDLQVQRAERHVQELEQTEADLVQQLSGEDAAESKEAAAGTDEPGATSSEEHPP